MARIFLITSILHIFLDYTLNVLAMLQPIAPQWILKQLAAHCLSTFNLLLMIMSLDIFLSALHDVCMLVEFN